jgi:hypothetical protein
LIEPAHPALSIVRQSDLLSVSRLYLQAFETSSELQMGVGTVAWLLQ